MLVNPADVASTEITVRDAKAAALAIGLQIQVLNVNTIREIDSAFETMARDGYEALFVGASPYLSGRRVQLAQLAAFNRLPATYSNREYVEAGGLISYGSNISDALRQVGVYAGRILKGAKPAGGGVAPRGARAAAGAELSSWILDRVVSPHIILAFFLAARDLPRLSSQPSRRRGYRFLYRHLSRSAPLKSGPGDIDLTP